MVSAPTSGTPASGSPGLSPPLGSEPSPSLRQKPGTIEVHLPSLNALLDRATPPSHPHTGPMVERSVARFLLDCAREQLGQPEVEVVVTLDEAPLPPSVEADARSQMRRYFANEAELASLDLRHGSEKHLPDAITRRSVRFRSRRTPRGIAGPPRR